MSELLTVTPKTTASQEMDELRRLELRQMATHVVLATPELTRVDRMLGRWISGLLLRAGSPTQAVNCWQRLLLGDITRHPFTPAQKQELALPGNRIEALFEDVQGLVRSAEPSLTQALNERIEGDHGHRWNDQYEARQTPKRSLALLKSRGVQISIPHSQLESIRQLDCDDRTCPILDRVKNMKIANINGFRGSKMSLSVHDVFDHFWYYSFLEEKGLLDLYAGFLRSVGNPQTTDIFSREGELIASIAFDYRGYRVSGADYSPLFTLRQIKRIFANSKKVGLSTDNQERAASVARNLDAGSDEGRGLAYVFSGVAIELMEQRRKHGFIRILDGENNPVGILSVIDPEYTALLVEAHHLCYAEQGRVDKVLLNNSALVEDYLQRATSGQTKAGLTVSLKTLEEFDPAQSNLAPETIAWMKKNIGFTANRRELC